jgi:hypothetical protein
LGVALSFLYLALYSALVRLLQLVRLKWSDRDELAVEILVLRHEVAFCAGRWPARRCGPRTGRSSPG